MKIYVSRYSNPELRTGDYTAVRISIGTPRWSLGYELAGEIKDLMPFGLFKDPRYNEYEAFKEAYFKKLDAVGVDRISKQLSEFAKRGKDVVLLCYEDIRKDPKNWCHRTAFAEWWKEKTFNIISELYDPTDVKGSKSKSKPKETSEQMSMFQMPMF